MPDHEEHAEPEKNQKTSCVLHRGGTVAQENHIMISVIVSSTGLVGDVIRSSNESDEEDKKESDT